jgi:hypothetical protein
MQDLPAIFEEILNLCCGFGEMILIPPIVHAIIVYILCGDFEMDRILNVNNKEKKMVLHNKLHARCNIH